MTISKAQWDGFTDYPVADVRPEFLPKWKHYLNRIHEESVRSWPGETPLGRMGWLDPCRKILDIGCGAGYAMKELRDKGKEVHGLDATRFNVDEAKKVHGFDVTLGDMHDLPFDDQSFDGILAWDVFEHSFAPMIVLWEMERILRPNGKMLMYIPGEHWTEHRVHMLIPTRLQMDEMISKAGLTIQNTEPDASSGMLLDIVKPS